MTGGIWSSSLLFAGPTGQANAVQMRVLSVVKTNATLRTGRAECVQRSSVASTHHKRAAFRVPIEFYAGSGAVGCSRRARFSRADTPLHSNHWPAGHAARAASASTGKPPSHLHLVSQRIRLLDLLGR